jgi:hypothetical protein
LAFVVVAVGAFVVGRVSSNGDSAHAAAQTPAQTPRGVVTTTTAAPAKVPTLSFGEALEARPDKPLDNATRDALAADLVAAREVSTKYPTVADAVKGGLVQAGKFAPGAGAHYIDYANTSNEIRPDGSLDVTKPGAYIYDGISPTSRLVGLMYISLAETPPAGFPGPNDHWHRHSNLCIKYGPSGISVPFAPDRDVTRAQCDVVHGQFMQKTVWMVHAWVVPGWESPKGVFSHANADLTCADGTMKTDPIGFCKGT